MKAIGKIPIFMVIMAVMVGIEGALGFKEALVGGHKGWRLPDSNQTDFYNQWAQSRRFHVGDSLRFQYQNESVLVVDKYGFYHCDPSKASSSYNDGDTVIKLENPGLTYFISGSPDHCHHGLRMAVDVMSPHGHSPAPESKEGAEAPGTARKSGTQMTKMSELLGLLVMAFSVFLF